MKTKTWEIYSSNCLQALYVENCGFLDTKWTLDPLLSLSMRQASFIGEMLQMKLKSLANFWYPQLAEPINTQQVIKQWRNSRKELAHTQY